MNTGWETNIGLEIHAELCTEYKLFCPCQNRFGAPPNTLCCPVCLGKPGAPGPVLNRQALTYALRLGYALGCTVNLSSSFDRKHYNYPDLPKGYQITQYSTPICQDGALPFRVGEEECRAEIQRIQLEEDAGKLSRQPDGSLLVDYNRSGVPLVEVITAPTLSSARQARACMEEMATILLFLGISDGKLQEGSLRADVNISLRKRGEKQLGQRCEMKNISGFSAIERAVTFEEKRQMELLQRGVAIQPETRRWDDAARLSFPLREKAGEGTYCFQPEPDLSPLQLQSAWVEDIQKKLPELPRAKALRYAKEYALPPRCIEGILKKPEMAYFFEKAAACELCRAENLANWICGDLVRCLRCAGLSLQDSPLQPCDLAELLSLVEANHISGNAAKQLLAVMVENGGDAASLAEEKGLMLSQDTQKTECLARKLIAENPSLAEKFRRGKHGLLGYFVEQGLKQSQAETDPAQLKDFLLKVLEADAPPLNSQ